MRQVHTVLKIETPGRGLVEIMRQIERWFEATGIRNGLLTVFIRHTSASLLVQENADPQVQRDLERFLATLVRDGDPLFEHRSEGADDMPAHVRSALTQTQFRCRSPTARSRSAPGRASTCTSTACARIGAR